MNLTANPPTPPNVIAEIPTGISGDYDGPLGIAACIASWNGEAGSAANCGDDRADEMALSPNLTAADGTTHQVLAVINGDPGLPFITFLDVTNILSKTGTPADFGPHSANQIRAPPISAWRPTVPAGNEGSGGSVRQGAGGLDIDAAAAGAAASAVKQAVLTSSAARNAKRYMSSKVS